MATLERRHSKQQLRLARRDSLQTVTKTNTPIHHLSGLFALLFFFFKLVKTKRNAICLVVILSLPVPVRVCLPCHCCSLFLFKISPFPWRRHRPTHPRAAAGHVRCLHSHLYLFFPLFFSLPSSSSRPLIASSIFFFYFFYPSMNSHRCSRHAVEGKVTGI